MSSTAKIRSRLSRKARAKALGKKVEHVMRRLGVAITGLELPAVEKISQSREEDPFQVTIATLLSARTQDATTYAASERLLRSLGFRFTQRELYAPTGLEHPSYRLDPPARSIGAAPSGAARSTDTAV